MTQWPAWRLAAPLAALVVLGLACAAWPGAAASGYPPFPTATAYAPPAQTRGVYTNPAYGIVLDYPAGWQVDDQGESVVMAWFNSRDQSINAQLFAGSPGSSQTLEEIALSQREGSLGDMRDLAMVSSGPVTLADGRAAWTTVSTTAFDDGQPLKMNMTTTLVDTTTFTLMVYGEPSDYDRLEGEITALVQALQVGGRTLLGVPRSEALVLLSGESTNPRSYDPATASSGVDSMVFSGLVALGAGHAVVPDLAATWQVSDGLVYTFTLRADARFHNGRPVTAHDVAYSWERAAAPETASDTVLIYLGDIVGVRERHAGQASRIAGLRVVDDQTLVVTLDAPKPYFLLKLTYGTAFVVDRANVETGPEWYRTPNGTGPYRLVRWERFEYKRYERNEDYYRELPPRQHVIVHLYAGSGARMYETGDIDMTGLGIYDLPRFQDPLHPRHADLVSGVNQCTSYLAFDVTRPPFDDAQVRQAFSLAFDRERYLEVVLQGHGRPARGLYPPGLPGFNRDLRGLPYDPAEARRLLAESRYGGPEGLPPILYSSGGFGSYVGPSEAALAAMWQQNLGVTLHVENIEPNRYYDEVQAGHHGHLIGSGWCADYPDPENFADVLLHTDGPHNLGHYSNPEVDALLDRARTEPDWPTRLGLYQAAEQRLVDDAALLFTTHSQWYALISPSLREQTCASLTRAVWCGP